MDILQFLADTLDLIIFVVLLAVGYFWGRRNERRHLEDLARRERLQRGILVFATRYPPPSSVPLDPVLVSGGVVVAADYFKMFVAGLRKLVGGRFAAYETLVARGRREALLRLKENARAAGCRAVYNVRYLTTQIQSGPRGGPPTLEVLAYGTAFTQAPGGVADSLHHQQADAASLAGAEPLFDLMKNKASRLALMFSLAALVYLALEFFGLQDEAYLGERPTGGLVTVALVVTLALGRYCRRQRVPVKETLAILLLAGLLGFGAAHYLALRLNALTASAPAAPTVYLVREGGRLVPREPGPPELHLFQFPEYWASLGQGAEYPVRVRRGGLGFWQYDKAEIVARVRQYYRAHPVR